MGHEEVVISGKDIKEKINQIEDQMESLENQAKMQLNSLASQRAVLEDLLNSKKEQNVEDG